MAAERSAAHIDLPYRRALVMAAAAGALSLALLGVTGQPLAGGLICVGLGLGAWNSLQVREAFPRMVTGGVVDRRTLSVGGLRRLGFVTFVALLLAVGFRPVGWTAAIGLAAFQLLMLANTVGPLLREVRKG